VATFHSTGPHQARCRECYNQYSRDRQRRRIKRPRLSGQTVAFDGDRVRNLVAELARDADLSRFIL
jgi:hypothetical protein